MTDRNFVQDITLSLTKSFAALSEDLLGYDRPDMPRYVADRWKLLMSGGFAIGFVVFYQQSTDMDTILKIFGLASIFCSFMFFFLYDVRTMKSTRR